MTNDTPRSKVARLIEQYDLDGVGAELERKWTRTQDRVGLRALADEFNRRLLRSALEAADAELIEGEVENLYRLLTAEDVTSGVREQARGRLEQRGLDPEQLEDDFVSYQSIRTYLQNYREASRPEQTPSAEERRQTKRDTVQRLTTRLGNVAERSLAELREAGQITLGEFDVVVNVRVHCADCHTQRSIASVLSSGGCDCAASE